MSCDERERLLAEESALSLSHEMGWATARDSYLAAWGDLPLELAVVSEGRARNLFNDQLADGHVGVESDVEGAEVDQF
jgi:hypothetical protein